MDTFTSQENDDGLQFCILTESLPCPLEIDKLCLMSLGEDEEKDIDVNHFVRLQELLPFDIVTPFTLVVESSESRCVSLKKKIFFTLSLSLSLFLYAACVCV